MSYGFGIIGCGKIAPAHAAAIARVRGARLAGCFDVNVEAAERLSAAYGGRVYGSLEQMLCDTQVQIVTICTPSGRHLGPALAAADAGKHLLVEKPLEINLPRCDQIIDACRRNQVTLSTIFPLRFYPSSAKLKQALDCGQLGTPVLGSLGVKWHRSAEYYADDSWRGTWEGAGGGVLMNQAIHGIDLLLWLLGPVAEVNAHTANRVHHQIAVEDTAVASMRFANNALGVIAASTAVCPGYQTHVAVYGSHGSAMLQEHQIAQWDLGPAKSGQRVRATVLRQRSTATASRISGHQRQFRNFLAAIRQNRQPDVAGLEGRRAVELVSAIYRSSQTGERVRLA